MLRTKQPFVIIIKTLNFWGLWEPSDLSKRHKICAVFAYLLFWMFSMFVFSAYKQIENVNGLSHYMVTAPGFFYIHCLCLNFIIKQKQIAMLVDDIGVAIEKDPLSHCYIEKSLRLSKTLTYVKIIIAIGCAIFALIIPVVLGTLMVPIWQPVRLHENSYHFYFVYLIQSSSFIYGGPIFIMIQEIMLSLLIIIRGYQEFIQNQLRIMILDDLNGIQEIQKCVESNINLKRFVDTVNEIFTYPVAFHTFFVGYFWCAIIYILINYQHFDTETILTFVLYGILVFMQVFQLCLIGETIESASKEFIYDIFSCDWINTCIKIRKSLIIMIECMKKPIIFSALGIININLQTFLGLLHATYSAYAVFQNFPR